VWADYKAFLLRGSLLDVAAAFVLGVAFASVITAFTEGILMPLIAAVIGQPDFDGVVVTLGDTPILVGTFLTALVNFVLIASVLFLVVRAAVRFRRPKSEPEGPQPDTDEVVLLREIRDALRQGT
jgi:large conductance mechanosensitive channel